MTMNVASRFCVIAVSAMAARHQRGVVVETKFFMSKKTSVQKVTRPRGRLRRLLELLTALRVATAGHKALHLVTGGLNRAISVAAMTRAVFAAFVGFPHPIRLIGSEMPGQRRIRLRVL